MKIAIAGYGVEGKASYEYWSNAPDSELVIVDEREAVSNLPSGARTMLGAGVFSKLNEFDKIIRSPSVHPGKLPYGDKVWSATNEFFEKCPAPIIGVTGTKGKGTTSSLIASILQASGKKVYLLGNIGTPALNELKSIRADDIVVFELSSFQLWDLKKSPHVAVVLGIEPDHLDVHTDMDEYVGAKANITLHQSKNDVLVFNEHNEIAQFIAHKSQARKAAYPIDMTHYADAVAIPGEHNIENAAAAVMAVGECNISQTDICKGLTNFKGLPHRIKFIREVNGIKFYDDSYSSAPAASLAALRSFEEPRVILLGGFERNSDFTQVASYIANNPSVQVIIYGASRQRISETLTSKSVEKHRMYMLDTVNFDEIVQAAVNISKPGDVVILSPGSASFDMFDNFTDRGEQFIRIVEAL